MTMSTQIWLEPVKRSDSRNSYTEGRSYCCVPGSSALTARSYATVSTMLDPGLAAAQFKFIGMLPSEEEWLVKYASHSEPLVIPYKGPIERPDEEDVNSEIATRGF